MNFILLEIEPESIYPIALTQSIADIRIGILTIKEKWQVYLQSEVYINIDNYLSEKYNSESINGGLAINSKLIPNKSLLVEIEGLSKDQILLSPNNQILAIPNYKNEIPISDCLKREKVISQSNNKVLNNTWEIFSFCEDEIKNDIQLLKLKPNSNKIKQTNTLIGDDIYVEEGAKVSASILNSETGPIYIGKNAEVMEGSIIRGPFVLGENSVVKMGSKIYGATSIGPFCKVGGEINNSSIQGYSNKGHDGFLGNSVIGKWCNLGADTNNSNLKNNYGIVKMWNYQSQSMEPTDRQFLGLIMGDYSKSGINTMFNTGTVVGANANIFGAGFPPKFIPSFSWGAVNDNQVYDIQKSFEAAEKMMERRNKSLTDIDKNILKHIFRYSEKFRS